MNISLFSSLVFAPQFLKQQSLRGKSTRLEKVVETVDNCFCFRTRTVEVISIRDRGLVYRKIQTPHSCLKEISRILACVLIIPIIVLLVLKLVLRIALSVKYRGRAIETEFLGKTQIIDRYLTLPSLSPMERNQLDVSFSLILLGLSPEVLEDSGIALLNPSGINKKFSFILAAPYFRNRMFTYVPGLPETKRDVPRFYLDAVSESEKFEKYAEYAYSCFSADNARELLKDIQGEGAKIIQREMVFRGLTELSDEDLQLLIEKHKDRNQSIRPACLEKVPCFFKEDFLGHAGIIVTQLGAEGLE
ncbi:hypothetical protein [Chlamydia vaughanii]|uniref:hypothetical protein n=1 Tax=Chlamydia vaughanii TaxID=3112552 RepID=UPI0039F520CD